MKIKSIIFYLIILQAIFGCVSGLYGKKLTRNIPKLQIDMTTAQVVQVLDQPDLVSANRGQTIWSYNLLVMNEMIERTVGYSLVFENGKLVEYGENHHLTSSEAAIRDSRAQQYSSLTNVTGNIGRQISGVKSEDEIRQNEENEIRRFQLEKLRNDNTKMFNTKKRKCNTKKSLTGDVLETSCEDAY